MKLLNLSVLLLLSLVLVAPFAVYCQEERQEEVWKWEEEAQARKRQNFEEIKALEAE